MEAVEAETPPTRQPWTGNRNAVVAAVALVAIVAIGLVLFFVLHNSKSSKPKPVIAIGPKAFKTESRLKLESVSINTKFYWAGPQPGVRYGFERTSNDYIFVRYLPHGMSVHNGAAVLTISTYPGAGAYATLKKKVTHIAGPGGSVIWIDPKHRTSAYMAWPNKNVEVEVFARTARQAKFTARSGRVQPIR